MRIVILIIVVTVLSACTSSQSFVLEGNKSDGEYRLKKAAPVYYPQNAMSRGIEGWVELKYDIDKKGNVKNIIVIAEHPKGIFTDEAVSSMKKTKYHPSMKTGMPSESIGVLRRINFKLTEAPKNKTCSDAISDSVSKNSACQRL